MQPLWEAVWGFLKTLKTETLCDPATSLLGIYLKKLNSLIQKDTCAPMFTAALFIRATIWKQPKCPQIDEWMKNLAQTYNRILLNLRKERNLAICNNMNGCRVLRLVN